MWFVYPTFIVASQQEKVGACAVGTVKPRISKIITVGLKMDSGNAIKNCYIVKIVRV